MIDDSSLFHGTYDPVKAREYYLRTRKLKGRKKGSSLQKSGRPGGHLPATVGKSAGRPNRADTKSRRAELLAQKVALEKRLEHLREVLAQRVKEAKALGAAPKPKKDEKGKAPETQVDKADRNNAEKKAKPLTSSQKAKKAKAAKDAYEKEHPTSLSQDVEILKAQVQDIRKKIKKSIQDAQERKNQAGRAQMVRSNAKSKPNDGPRGR